MLGVGLGFRLRVGVNEFQTETRSLCFRAQGLRCWVCGFGCWCTVQVECLGINGYALRKAHRSICVS